MELITGINKVMAYTEENLKGELDPKNFALRMSLCGISAHVFLNK